jgi:predicted nucleotidyltransferase
VPRRIAVNIAKLPDLFGALPKESKDESTAVQVKIPPEAIEEILRFVDRMVPAGTTEVWLCGSRAKGTARPNSDWDVVAFHPVCSKHPKDLFKSNQLGEHSLGGQIELVIAHPDHWNDGRQYMTDCRAFGIKLR